MISFSFGCRYSHRRGRWIPMVVVSYLGAEIVSFDVDQAFRRACDKARRHALENGIAGKVCPCGGANAAAEDEHAGVDRRPRAAGASLRRGHTLMEGAVLCFAAALALALAWWWGWL